MTDRKVLFSATGMGMGMGSVLQEYGLWTRHNCVDFFIYCNMKFRSLAERLEREE